MTATVKLPAVLSDVAGTDRRHQVAGTDVAAALDDLFRQEPKLRGHVVDEQGAIRTHVSVFVDGRQAHLETPVGENAEIWIIQGVSGGSTTRSTAQ